MAFKRASDGKWVETISTPTGRKAFYGDTKAEAQEKARAATAKATAGIKETGKLTVGAFLEDWLESTVKPYSRENTYVSYANTVRTHLVPALGDVPLRSLTSAQCQAFITDRTDTHGFRVLELGKAVLRTALNHACQSTPPLLAANPAANLKMPEREAAHVRAQWSAGETGRFMAETAGTDWDGLFTFLLDSVCRVGEAIGLEWGDVDFAAKTVCFKRHVIDLGGELKVVQGTKTTTASKTEGRVVELSDKTMRALKTQQARAAARALARGTPAPAQVFAPLRIRSATTTYLRRNAIAKALDAFAAKAGVPRINVHGLRHTGATLLIAAGMDIATVSHRLGHAKISTTLDIYVHKTAAQGKAAAGIMNSILSGGKVGAQNE